MSYCSGQNGRDSNNFQPSTLDLLGLQILYPANQNDHWLGCMRGCFNIGRDVIVRVDGQIAADFTAQGAINVVPKWRLGWASPIVEVLDASLVNSGVLRFSYGDWWNRVHQGVGTVTKSDANHTAIVASLVQTSWM
jgi:hypothetical protein